MIGFESPLSVPVSRCEVLVIASPGIKENVPPHRACSSERSFRTERASSLYFSSLFFFSLLPSFVSVSVLVFVLSDGSHGGRLDAVESADC